jgi:nucleoside-diphosphate-sugar epimerase
MLAASLSQRFLKISTSWNFAPTSTSDVAVKELVNEFIKVIGRGTYHTEAQHDSPHESTYLQLDASLANTQLNWHPRLNVSSSVQWAANWYKDVLLEKTSAEDKVLEQINDYLQ